MVPLSMLNTQLAHERCETRFHRSQSALLRRRGEAKNRLPRIYVKLHTVSRQQDWRTTEKPIFDGSIA